MQGRAGVRALAFLLAEHCRGEVICFNFIGGLMRALVSMATMMLICGAAVADQTQTPSVVSDSAAPDGTVSLTATSVAAGVGWVWGNGQLSFKGKPHTFKISGLSVVDAGVSSVTASGEVYNLAHLNDFSGNYTVASAGIALGGGAGASYLKNEHGVIIKLVETEQGLRFNLSGEGVKLTLSN